MQLSLENLLWGAEGAPYGGFFSMGLEWNALMIIGLIVSLAAINYVIYLMKRHLFMADFDGRSAFDNFTSVQKEDAWREFYKEEKQDLEDFRLEEEKDYHYTPESEGGVRSWSSDSGELASDWEKRTREK